MGYFTLSHPVQNNNEATDITAYYLLLLDYRPTGNVPVSTPEVHLPVTGKLSTCSNNTLLFVVIVIIRFIIVIVIIIIIKICPAVDRRPGMDNAPCASVGCAVR